MGDKVQTTPADESAALRFCEDTLRNLPLGAGREIQFSDIVYHFAKCRISSANEAIEEAAQTVEDFAKAAWEGYDLPTITNAIRALKSGSESHGG